MFVCVVAPTVALIVMRNAYFYHEHIYKTTSSVLRRLVPVVWHNVGIVSKMRLAMHILAFFKKLQRWVPNVKHVFRFKIEFTYNYILYCSYYHDFRGTLEKEVLLLLIAPLVSSLYLPFLTFASQLLAPLNMDKLELDQWLYSKEQKGFNEQLVVVLFEWYDVTAINSYFDFNWLTFFGFLGSIVWLCSSKETNRPIGRSFRTVLHKNVSCT